MKFGKEFRTHLEETLPEWRDKFLCYKPLKKLLKDFPSSSDFPQAPPPPATSTTTSVDHHRHHHDHHDDVPPSLLHLQHGFVRILTEELEKFNDFYVDKEEDFVIRFQELKERIERVKEKSSGVFSSESEFSEEIMDIRKEFVTIHGEMVLLKNYSSLNFAESLTRLVHECEENLELLFPLEEEVIESTPTAPDGSKPPLNNSANVSADTSTLGDETLDVYRSTLAAMKAIRGLQKASSTSNPLSFSSLFRSQEDESGGAVTAENSASNSPTMKDGEDDQDDDTHST
ncbi:hypothetical protein Pint_19186 [Pistacia integerrima]|uniref:Uncharacterized protein n=1 Tax=Pistacia integerrima TaxID=434235 RepID=A0ACC0YXW5_9ROSI|nr:hypothetical protein Pint_19186 [Pistacia integerrima]